ncbi:hypothetical protein Bca4012_014665 [Brassica carinata]
MRTLISPSLPPLFSLPLPKPSLFFSRALRASRHPLTTSAVPLNRLPTNPHRSSVPLRKLQTEAAASKPFSAPGEIHVVVGPMFSGKTTTLLRRILSERETGKKVAVIKSDKDDRYCAESIVTHDGEKFPCWALPDLSSFKERFGFDAYRNRLDVIGIDEAQFFGDLYEFCRQAADEEGKTVIVAGLDGDYLRRRFGSVLDLVPVADTVTKLASRCEVCGKRASFTLRKTEERATELIGGAEVYMPVCRSHYVSGQGVLETARAVLDASSQRNATHDVAAISLYPPV